MCTDLHREWWEQGTGIQYRAGYRRGVLSAHFKDSVLLNVLGFSLHEILFALELEAGKIHAGPKRHLYWLLPLLLQPVSFSDRY